MKYLQAATFIVVILTCSYIGITWRQHLRAGEPDKTVQGTPTPVQPASTPESPAPPPPREISQTLSFMPGQFLNIPNRRARLTEIHSEFPIRVVEGPQSLNYGVQFFYDGDPYDISITDMRPRPVFTTPRGNEITISLREY